MFNFIDMKYLSVTVLFLLFNLSYAYSQIPTYITEKDTIDYSSRKRILLGSTAGIYTTGSAALYFAWYKQNEMSGFHFFDDGKEWLYMDKLGHLYSGYNQTAMAHKAFKWAGYNESNSLLYGSLMSLGFQTTIEVMDGFSENWGFSVWDMGYNVGGVFGYYIQEKLWQEQRIKLKMSYWPVTYSKDLIQSESGQAFTSLDQRTNQLFGGSIERFLKDYNGQTIWLSFNLKSFWSNSPLLDWLSLAIGYSGQQMFGGFENQWTSEGHTYVLTQDFNRYKQIIVALDYDLSQIRTQSKFVNTLLDIGNLIKWPAPGLEYNPVDGFKFHIIFKN